MRPRSLLLCLSLAACGKVSSSPDAGPADADLRPDADPHGVVHVTVLDILGNGAPEANVPVVFINPDGEVVADTTSDTTGKAQATILPGATVTAVWLRSNRYTMGTIYDIKPGDDLTLGFTDRDTTSAGTFPVSIPALSGATSYAVYGPCGSTSTTPGTPAQLPLTNSCKPATFDVFVVASGSSGPIEFAEKRNVQLTDGSATIPNTWQGFSQFNAQYTSVPSDITGISVSRASASPQGFAFSDSGTPQNGSLTINHYPVATAGTKALVSSTFSRADNTQQIVRQRVAGDATSYGVDVGTSLLPWVTNISFDPATQTLAGQVDGTSSYDAYAVDFLYNRPTASLSFEWIVFSQTGHDLVLPAIPAHLGGVNPMATDSLSKPFAILFDSTSLDGWDQVRAHVFDEIDEYVLSSGNADTVRASIGVGK